MFLSTLISTFEFDSPERVLFDFMAQLPWQSVDPSSLQLEDVSSLQQDLLLGIS
jgi:hypothetical protein